MNTNGTKKLLSSLALLGLSMSASAEQGVYSNLTGDYEDTGSFPVAGNPLFQSFTTGSSVTELSSLTLEGAAITPSDGGSIGVALFADNSTSPAAAALETIATIADSTLADYLNAFTVSLPSSQVALAPDTRYWIGVYDASPSLLSSSFIWGEIAPTFNPDAIGVAGQYAETYGSTYPIPTTFDGTTYGGFEMQLAVTAVPLPATLGLFGIGLFGLGFARRRLAVAAEP
jgi:hypothetical protein